MADSFYAALRISDFRRMLVARLMVTLALQIQCVAVGWQIYAITKDPLSLGIAGLCEAFPAISISLYAGHIADLIDRRLIALISVFTLTVSMGVLAFCSASALSAGSLVMFIYGAIALSGFARGFYGPAVFGMMSDIVPRELYGNAIAWNTIIFQGSAVVGPCVAGLLYVLLNASKTYLISTLFLTLSFFFFFLIKSRTSHTPQEGSSVLENIQEGLRFVFSNEVLLGAMTLDLFAVLFGGTVALLPIFAAKVFHSGPQVLGILRAAPSLGALLTAFALTHRPLIRNSGAVLLTVVAGFGLCMIAFGLSTNLYLSLFLLVISGALDGASVWLRNTIFQLTTPNTMKGRVSAVNSMFVNSSNEIGEFESGVAAKIMGLVPSVVFGGCMTLFVVLVTAFRTPKLRKLHLDNLYKSTDS